MGGAAGHETIFYWHGSGCTMNFSKLDWTSLGIGIAVGVTASTALYAGYRILKLRLTPASAPPGKSYRQKDSLSLYVNSHNPENQLLSQLRSVSAQHQGGSMTTGQDVGRLLTVLTKSVNARKVLDIGVFTGCSAFALALGLSEGGTVIACDVNEEYVSIGKPFWVEGGVAGMIDLRLQPATQTLQDLMDNEESETFDVIFIDADKENYLKYYEMGMDLLRSGGLIVVDNALWGGSVANPTIQDLGTASIRQVNARMKNDPRVDYVLVNVSDGIGLARKI